MPGQLISAILLIIVGLALVVLSRGRRGLRSAGVAAILVGIVLALSLLYTNATAPRVG